jgi:hypothetical protein
MKLFTIGVVALLSALLFTSESDPLNVRSYVDVVTGGEPINAYASSHAIIEGFSPAADVSVEWEIVEPTDFKRMDKAINSASSSLDKLCQTASVDVKKTIEYENYCGL